MESQPPSHTESEEEWDIMLSYRHAKHKNAASLLASFLDEAGVRCWLDLRTIDQSARLTSDQLKSILRHAAESSRIVVGFPVEDSVEMDPRSRRTRTVFNWLFWERQFAREVLWISGTFLCSFPDERIPFFNLPHLAYYLGLACGKGRDLSDFWNKYFGIMPAATRQAYRTENLHDLPPDFLPSIIHPERPTARRNAIHRFNIRKRQDLAPDHKMQIFD